MRESTQRIKRKKFLLPIFLLLFVLLVGITVPFALDSVVAEEWIEERKIEAEYELETELTIPERKVTVNGVTETATFSLVYPSGNATYKSVVPLNEVGQYMLKYVANVSGKIYTKTYRFLVHDRLVKFNNKDESSVSYGKWDKVESAPSGLMVQLAQGDTLTFSSLIDVSEVTSQDTLISVFATPNAIGTADFEKFVFTFTDSVNPDIYLNVSARCAPVTNMGASYFLAGGNGQPMCGWEGYPFNKLHINNRYGAAAGHSFYGTSDPITSIDLRYDAQNNRVYNGSTFIIDLDDAQYFSMPWTGFPSKKVRLSVSCEYSFSWTNNFCITSVRGIDVSEATVDAIYVDDAAPEITVHHDPEKYDTMPVAKVGLEYPIPTATARDAVSGNCDVTARVYYNYASAYNAISMPLTDNKFTPTRAGSYAIVYKATDRAGNTATEVIWIESQNDVEAPSIYFDASTATTSGVLGEWITVPTATATATSGHATVRITATNGDTIYDATSGGFRPEKEGTYTVKATATDYLGQATSSDYTISIERGTKPLFIDTPTLPRYFISGYSYRLPEYYVNDYTSGTLVRQLTTAQIKDASGAPYTVSAGETFRPTVSQNGDTVEIVFKYGTFESEPIEIPTVIAFVERNGSEALEVKNYFITNGVTVSTSSVGTTLTAQNDGGSWTFANPLLADGFSISFMGVAAANNFSALNLRLEDSLNPDVAVSAKIVNNGSYAMLNVGNYFVMLSDGFASENINTIEYNNGAIVVGSSICAIDETVSGEVFNGFPSHKIYLSVAFEGVSGDAAYIVNSISNQLLTNTSRDRGTPRLVLLGRRADILDLNTTTTLPAAIVSDVLTPDVTASLTVYGANRQPVYDINGVLLRNVDPTKEYTIKLDAYGSYRVSYDFSDTNEAIVNNFAYSITVEDLTAPTVSFKQSAKKAKIGDVVILPEFTANDDQTSVESLIISKCVIAATGEMLYIPENSNSIKVTREGIYQFVVCVMDASGNMTLARYNIAVSE